MTDEIYPLAPGGRRNARPADSELIQQGKKAGRTHAMVAAAGGRTPMTRGPAVEQVFEGYSPEPAKKQARKEEIRPIDPRIAKLRLSPDGGALLDLLIKAAGGSGKVIDFTTDRAGEALGFGQVRTAIAKDELLNRGLIRPLVNSLGGSDGYRIKDLPA